MKPSIAVFVALSFVASLFISVLGPASADAQDFVFCNQGTLVQLADGPVCLVEGPPPDSADACPMSATVVEDNGDCFATSAPATTLTCPPSFNLLPGGVCKLDNPDANDLGAAVFSFTCPAGSSATAFTIGAQTAISSCSTPATVTSDCGAATLDVSSGLCRTPIQPIAGPLGCQTTFELVGTRCLREDPPVVVPTPRTVAVTSPPFIAPGPVSLDFFEPPPPGQLTVTYSVACVGQVPRLSSLVVDSTRGASLDLLTVNGSVIIGGDLQPGGPVTVVAVAANAGDLVVVTGPTVAPVCDNDDDAVVSPAVNAAAPSDVVGPLGGVAITVSRTGGDITLELPTSLTAWLEPTSPTSVSNGGSTLVSTAGVTSTMSIVIPAGDPVPTSVVFHGELRTGLTYSEVVTIP